jgi:hypothetical protein
MQKINDTQQGPVQLMQNASYWMPLTKIGKKFFESQNILSRTRNPSTFMKGYQMYCAKKCNVLAKALVSGADYTNQWAQNEPKHIPRHKLQLKQSKYGRKQLHFFLGKFKEDNQQVTRPPAGNSSYRKKETKCGRVNETISSSSRAVSIGFAAPRGAPKFESFLGHQQCHRVRHEEIGPVEMETNE